MDPTEKDDRAQTEEDKAPSAVCHARRRLLRIAVYTPPAVVGVLLISKEALGKPAVSCQPYLCKPTPCKPRGTCTPDPGVTRSPLRSCNPLPSRR